MKITLLALCFFFAMCPVFAAAQQKQVVNMAFANSPLP